MTVPARVENLDVRKWIFRFVIHNVSRDEIKRFVHNNAKQETEHFYCSRPNSRTSASPRDAPSRSSTASVAGRPPLPKARTPHLLTPTPLADPGRGLPHSPFLLLPRVPVSLRCRPRHLQRASPPLVHPRPRLRLCPGLATVVRTSFPGRQRRGRRRRPTEAPGRWRLG